MSGHVTVYRDLLGKNWIVDRDGGSRERPGRWTEREGFASWINAQAGAKAIVDSWRIQYPALRFRIQAKIEAKERAHRKAQAAIEERRVQAELAKRELAAA